MIGPLRAVLLLAVAALLGAAASPEETRLERAALSAYAAAKRPAPVVDPFLTRAARALSLKALADGPNAATAGDAVAAALSEAGSWDPPPRAIVLRTTPPGRALDAVESRTDLASLPATRLGVAFAAAGRSGAVVLLFSERRAFLEPFPRQVAAGATATLGGELVFPLYDGRVVVSGPSGVAHPAPRDAGARNRFEAEVRFPEPGTYTLEVVAQSAKGPEVAAIFRVEAGGERGAARAPAAPAEVGERTDLARAEGQVLAAINARRRAAGLKPLGRSATLDAAAAAHSEEMAAMGYFAHVSPTRGDLAERLTRAGFAFKRVAENLGEAATALDAHRGIESSPGHLANILDPQVDLVGIGTARVRRGGLENVLLTEVFARAAP